MWRGTLPILLEDAEEQRADVLRPFVRPIFLDLYSFFVQATVLVGQPAVFASNNTARTTQIVPMRLEVLIGIVRIIDARKDFHWGIVHLSISGRIHSAVVITTAESPTI